MNSFTEWVVFLFHRVAYNIDFQGTLTHLKNGGTAPLNIVQVCFYLKGKLSSDKISLFNKTSSL